VKYFSDRATRPLRSVNSKLRLLTLFQYRCCAAFNLFQETRMNTCSRFGCAKSVYVDSTGFSHPYCSRTCARLALGGSGLGSPIRANIPVPRLTTEVCKTPGCGKPVYVEPSGRRHPYCSRTCSINDRLGGSPAPPPYTPRVTPPTSNRVTERSGQEDLPVTAPLEPSSGSAARSNDLGEFFMIDENL
jgi:endogenous inhibitor of DNA gyrase (YacG/DUF329 family)